MTSSSLTSSSWTFISRTCSSWTSSSWPQAHRSPAPRTPAHIFPAPWSPTPGPQLLPLGLEEVQDNVKIKTLAGQAKYSPGHLRIENCNNCSYNFSSRKNLKDHIIRTHSRRKCQCNQCEKAFTQKGCLSAHMQFVHETYQFLCNKCTFKGNIQGYLKNHIIWRLDGKGPNVSCVMTCLLRKQAGQVTYEFIFGMDWTINQIQRTTYQ